jgi:hypothetical protein
MNMVTGNVMWPTTRASDWCREFAHRRSIPDDLPF